MYVWGIMGIKVQFNESTGRVSYTSGTGKIQVVSEILPPKTCNDCSPEPSEINVTLSDITLCCSTDYPSPTGESYKYSSDLLDILHDTHVLPNFAGECAYRKLILVSEGPVLNRYSTEDCTGAVDRIFDIEAIELFFSWNFTEKFRFTITIGHASGFNGSQRFFNGESSVCFDLTITDVKNENCGDQDWATSFITCLLAGGTAVVST